MRNTDCSSSHVPPISSFALSFCWWLPWDWKPEMVSAENLMGLMESLLMEARGALRLPPSCLVLQHRWYLIPFAPQWYMWTPAMQFCEGIKDGPRHVLEPAQAEMRWMSCRRKWCSCCIQTDNHGKMEDFYSSSGWRLALCYHRSSDWIPKKGSASVEGTVRRGSWSLID